MDIWHTYMYHTKYIWLQEWFWAVEMRDSNNLMMTTKFIFPYFRHIKGESKIFFKWEKERILNIYYILYNAKEYVVKGMIIWLGLLLTFSMEEVETFEQEIKAGRWSKIAFRSYYLSICNNILIIRNTEKKLMVKEFYIQNRLLWNLNFLGYCFQE